MHVGSSASDDYQIETLSGMVHGVLAFGSVREDPAKVLSPDGFQSLSVKHLNQQCHGYLMTQSVCHVKSHWMPGDLSDHACETSRDTLHLGTLAAQHHGGWHECSVHS